MDTTCEHVRESLSATADGEVAVLDAPTVATHVSSCAGCASYASGTRTLAATVAEARAVPQPIGDRLADVLSAGASPARDRVPQLRGLLALAALVQVVLAVLGLALGGDQHLVADLAVYELAAGAGLGVAAWRPRYAAGLLPTIALAAVAGLALVAVDVVAGTTSLAGELPHLVLVVATWPLVVLARLHPTVATVEAR